MSIDNNTEIQEFINMCQIVKKLSDERKCIQPIALDLSDYSAVCAVMMIVSFASQAQVRAFTSEVVRELEELGHELKHMNKDKKSEWFLLDYDGLFIHIMTQEQRDHYQLEEIWRKADKINLD